MGRCRQIRCKQTLSHPSKAHNPAYKAIAYSPSPPTIDSLSRPDTPPFLLLNHPLSFHSVLAPFPSPFNPVAATMIPMIVMANRLPTFRNSSESDSRVVSLVESIFSAVTKDKHKKAISLFAHSDGSTASASAVNDPVTTLLMYSPDMIAMIAAPPGFNTMTAVHEYKNPINSPKQYRKYTPLPPFKGIAPPNSA